MREASPRLAIGRCRDAAAFCFCTMQEPPAGAVKARVEPRQGKHPQKEAKPSDTRCRGLGALSCSDFVEVNRIVWLKCCARWVLHGQRVWDAAQQVLARQGALYIQRHCLQRLWWYHGALLAVVWRFFFIAAGKSGKFCRHGMCEIGRRFITALPPLHSLHETLYFHR